jgi:hypothetical protein
MAAEIKLTTQMIVSNGGLKRTWAPSQQSITQSTAKVTGGVVSVATSYASISLAALSASGWGHFTNLDATNYLELGVEVSSAFYPLVRLGPGESMAFRLAQSVTLFGRANTGACLLDFEVLNN